jgi:peptidoglycan hydrolase-like protein with peptidoglycan-binding domain
MGLKSWKLPIVAGVGLLVTSLTFASTPSKKQSSHPAVKKHKAHAATRHSTKKVKKGRARGQQAIDGERTREIQEALIREHYMSGEPSGNWDAATQQALHRYQADQGWQSKTVPDSRALIRLGLGPDHEHLLNPESAMTMPSEPSSHHAAAKTFANAKAVAVSQQASSSSAPSLPASSATVSASGMSNISPSR